MILRPIMNVIGALFSMAVLGLVMAGLSIGAVFYMYGRDLPSYEVLAAYTPKTISRIYSGEGEIMDEFADERRLFTPAEEIPEMVKQAFVSAEDQNFYTHSGYDPRGMAAAFVQAVQSRGSSVRGASTITQQVMKNFLLSSDRTAERKIKEIILANRMEGSMTKDDILELYLNEIFLGQNAYGITAAALTYFNKPLYQLRPGEAAYLAALAQRPSTLHPIRYADDALNRRNYVLRRMEEDGYIDRETMEAEQAQPLQTVQTGDVESFQESLPPRDYFTDEIRRQLTRNSEQYGLREGEDFASAGLTVRATVEPQMQEAAARVLREALEQYDRGLGQWHGTEKSIPEEMLATEDDWRAALAEVDVARDIDLGNPWHVGVVLELRDQEMIVGVENLEDLASVPREDIAWLPGNFFDEFTVGEVVHLREMTNNDGSRIRWTLRQVPEVQGAFMAMDVNTGRVIAMQGGFSYQHSVFNRATQAQRQPGSAFKPFVFATALDSGYTPATIVVDAPIEINTPQGLWRPTNASNQFYGPTPLRTGIERSRNLMTIRLAQEVGMDLVALYAERFGVYENMNRGLATALGADETTLFKMVAGYAMFANGGERVEPSLIDRVQDRYGRTVYRHDQRSCVDCAVPDLPAGEAPRITSSRERVINEITAYQLVSMMKGVVDRGTASSTVNLPVPIAGKTGTTNDAKDVWFVGFSSNIVAGCYIGYDTPRSLGRGASGGGICGPVFNQFMQTAIQRYGGGPFEAPEDCQFIPIDRYSGARLGTGASGSNVVNECFRPGEEPLFGITFDGGFAMASDLPLFEEVQRGLGGGRSVTTSTGNTVTVGPRAGFGTLSSGGLY